MEHYAVLQPSPSLICHLETAGTRLYWTLPGCAVSGKCYLSLHENNKSANRGECYQTCRKSYIASNIESGYELEIDNKYIMSPKDLCTIGFLDKLIESGVRILKIEGRARSSEYVKSDEAPFNCLDYGGSNDRHNFSDAFDC